MQIPLSMENRGCDLESSTQHRGQKVHDDPDIMMKNTGKSICRKHIMVTMEQNARNHNINFN